jgi:hypothetical protein
MSSDSMQLDLMEKKISLIKTKEKDNIIEYKGHIKESVTFHYFRYEEICLDMCKPNFGIIY